MSLLKYRDVESGSAGRLHWQRADLDGAPYSGPEMPLLRDSEFEAFAERRHDVHAKVFELWKPEDLLEYSQILDKVANRWYTLIKDETLPVPAQNSFVVLCAWSETSVHIPRERIDSILENVRVSR